MYIKIILDELLDAFSAWREGGRGHRSRKGRNRQREVRRDGRKDANRERKGRGASRSDGGRNADERGGHADEDCGTEPEIGYSSLGDENRPKIQEDPPMTDLYLPANDPEKGYVFPGRLEISPEIMPLVHQIMEGIKSKGGNSSNFSLSIDGKGFRCHRMPTWKGDYYIIRRMPEKVPTLRECGFSDRVISMMLDRRLSRGGLVVISGLPGSGKSTTAAALIADRLRLGGGICLTVEDPVEMPLQGTHGNGMCLQRNVEVQDDFADALRDTMRGYPVQSDSMILIGEVRDPRTAALALRASVDGRLVIFTMHAGNVVQAVKRLGVLASKELGESTARELIGGSFRLLIQQRLVAPRSRRTASSQEVVSQHQDFHHMLKYNFLLDTERAAAAMRSRGLSDGLIMDEARIQKTLLIQNRPIEVRRN